MAFIKNKKPKIGDWVTTKKQHISMLGIMERGTRVKITDIDPMRGYAIEDEEGNRLCEIGWTI